MTDLITEVLGLPFRRFVSIGFPSTRYECGSVKRTASNRISSYFLILSAVLLQDKSYTSITN
jgi:hypothetical protein